MTVYRVCIKIGTEYRSVTDWLVSYVEANTIATAIHPAMCPVVVEANANEMWRSPLV